MRPNQPLSPYILCAIAALLCRVACATDEDRKILHSNLRQLQDVQIQDNEARILSNLEGLPLGEFGSTSGNRHRRLSDAQTEYDAERDNRQCGEVIEVMTDTAIITQTVLFLIAGAGMFFEDPNNTGGIIYEDYYNLTEEVIGQSVLSFTAAYGYKAVKVCGSCGMYKNKIKKKYRAQFKDICGSGVYGHDSMFSGLALIPIDPDKEHIVKGALKGVVFSRGTQTDSFKVPSSTWPSTEEGGLQTILGDPFYFIDLVGAVMAAAGDGNVAIIPDGLGYGESRDCFKGVLVNKLYQTSSIPIFLKTKEVVSSMSHCSSELAESVIVSGHSEGGYGSIAVARGLNSIGVTIIKTLAGAPAIDLQVLVDSFLDKIFADKLSLQFSYVMPLFASAYSSTIPGLANSENIKQGILSENERLRVINFVLASLAIPDLRVLTVSTLGISGTGNQEDVNTDVFNELIVEAKNESKSICEDGVGLDDLCMALGDNGLKSTIENAEFPVEICHSPLDDLIPYGPIVSNSIYEPSYQAFVDFADIENKKNLYGHGASYPLCVVLQAYKALADNTDVEMSGRCTPSKSKGSKGGSKGGKHGKGGKKGKKGSKKHWK